MLTAGLHGISWRRGLEPPRRRGTEVPRSREWNWDQTRGNVLPAHRDIGGGPGVPQGVVLRRL